MLEIRLFAMSITRAFALSSSMLYSVSMSRTSLLTARRWSTSSRFFLCNLSKPCLFKFLCFCLPLFFRFFLCSGHEELLEFSAAEVGDKCSGNSLTRFCRTGFFGKVFDFIKKVGRLFPDILDGFQIFQIAFLRIIVTFQRLL